MVTRSQLGGPIFAGLRRAFGDPGRAKPAADQRAGRAGVDNSDRQSATTQPLRPTLSLASPNVRPLTEKPSAYQEVAEQPGVPDQVGQRLGDIASGLTRGGRAGADWTIRLAVNRAISPNSLTGISLLLGLCAAAWFSGGTPKDDLRGLITTGVWVVIRVAARQLAAVTAQRAVRPATRAAPAGRRQERQLAGSDWSVLPGFDWGSHDFRKSDIGQSATGQSETSQSEIGQSESVQSEVDQSETGQFETGQFETGQSDIENSSIGRAYERNFGWFYAVCATAAECAIYGGIAAGAESAGWKATWPLALAIVIVSSVAAIVRACGYAAARTGQSKQPAHALGALASLTFPPIGARVLLAALITVSYTPRLALVATLAVAVVSLAGNAIRTARQIAAGRQAAASPAVRAAMSRAQDMLLACRDDGPFARRAGWLVRGNLMPVPPAVAGFVAIGLLTVLGIKNLPGIVALTPVVVLLLAAPGSSHPHDGRFDWLAPLLLCLAQFGYLAALGAAKSVSWLLVFATSSMTAVWYASLAASQAAATPPIRMPSTRRGRVSQIMARRTEGIGWEGRIIVAGLAGMFGIATFGYLGLTACLGALIGRKMFIDYLRQGEDQRQ